jgi:hypothetical protein
VDHYKQSNSFVIRDHLSLDMDLGLKEMNRLMYLVSTSIYSDRICNPEMLSRNLMKLTAKAIVQNEHEQFLHRNYP